LPSKDRVTSPNPLSRLAQVVRKNIDFNLDTGFESGVIDNATVFTISVKVLPITSPK